MNFPVSPLFKSDKESQTIWIVGVITQGLSVVLAHWYTDKNQAQEEFKQITEMRKNFQDQFHFFGAEVPKVTSEDEISTIVDDMYLSLCYDIDQFGSPLTLSQPLSTKDWEELIKATNH
ncbi:conserved hypothetical protein [Vibrio chagasii]|nr:conserved hypothetical protein [Vibrio chagasii]